MEATEPFEAVLELRLLPCLHRIGVEAGPLECVRSATSLRQPTQPAVDLKGASNQIFRYKKGVTVRASGRLLQAAAAVSEALSAGVPACPAGALASSLPTRSDNCAPLPVQ